MPSRASWPNRNHGSSLVARDGPEARMKYTSTTKDRIALEPKSADVQRTRVEVDILRRDCS